MFVWGKGTGLSCLGVKNHPQHSMNTFFKALARDFCFLTPLQIYK
ncbi:hypothetical protein HHE02_02760 [Helicobacter heilmannii]|nr:hypothetical protein HHE02_02760 [Helicobacter heilmannii]CRF49739.1 hypothetical protein HHE03_14050 [Helicobacter heilmannii]